jgi:hypothetical protein
MSTPTSEILHTGRLSREQLSARLAAPRLQVPFAILESLGELAFPASSEEIVLENWPKGRVFGPAFELRWEYQSGTYLVWWAGHAPGPVPELVELPMDPGSDRLEVIDSVILLWGPGNTSLARPPDYRCLPEGKGYPSLTCREFRRSNGSLAFYRFTGMQWKEEAR